MKEISFYIDEAGRGPLAGPIYCGLIVPLKEFDKTEFNDSKKIPEKKRQLLYNKIIDLEKQGYLLFSTGTCSNKEIDNYGLTKSTNISIARGLYFLIDKLYQYYIKPNYSNSTNGDDILNLNIMIKLLNKKIIDYSLLINLLKQLEYFCKIKGLFIDGNNDFKLKDDIKIRTTTIINGDEKNKNISIASIIAKVERDNYMKSINNDYPNYELSKNKGYGTKNHTKNIIKYGISPIHRTSFLNKIIGTNNEKTNNKIVLKSLLKLNKPNKNTKPTLLIHICCAPDLTYPLKYLQNYFKLYLLWYNPNIDNKIEHKKRYDTYKKLTDIENGNFKIIEYNNDEHFLDLLVKNKEIITINKNTDIGKIDFIKKIGNMPELGKRCELCYYLRLFKAAEISLKNNIQYFTTTLSISPKKDLSKIKKFGLLAEKNNKGTKFILFDFKKKGGYLKSIELSKKYGLYRQKYCGCNRSKKIIL